MIWNEKQIENILKSEPNILVIVDEAYFEFSRSTVSRLVTRYPNLIVCRSFSKAFGLANIRMGYLLADPKCLSVLRKIRIGKNLGMISQIAAAAALDDLPYMESYVERAKLGAEWAVSNLRSLGWKVVNTQANFFLVQVNDPDVVETKLANRHVFVRSRKRLPKMEHYVRITAAPISIMTRFLNVWREVINLND